MDSKRSINEDTFCLTAGVGLALSWVGVVLSRVVDMLVGLLEVRCLSIVTLSRKDSELFDLLLCSGGIMVLARPSDSSLASWGCGLDLVGGGGCWWCLSATT